jgi:hypothetical protein
VSVTTRIDLYQLPINHVDHATTGRLKCNYFRELTTSFDTPVVTAMKAEWIKASVRVGDAMGRKQVATEEIANPLSRQ